MTTPAEIPALIDHVLETHHALLRREVPALSVALAEAPAAVKRPWGELATLLEGHLMKEEHVLFPSARGLVEGGAHHAVDLSGPLAQMDLEHEQIETLVGALREALEQAGAAREALAVVLDDLVVHAGLEDDTLFPAIAALADARADEQALAEAEARAAAAEKIRAMQSERAPEKKERRGGRLRRLAKRVLRR
jgi:regulator of cell morphogenesis and NO signaling